MHKNRNKNKKSRGVKAKKNKSGVDEKKCKFEDVHHTALSFLKTSKSFRVNDYVKLNMNNSLKHVNKTALNNVEDLNKQGNFLFCVFVV